MRSGVRISAGPLIIKKGEISDILIIEPSVFKDSRGYFFETYSEEKYFAAGIPSLVQFNQSFSVKGVLRGLHYQEEPYAQGKLVSVSRGLVQDVAVDIRKNSETFLKYVSVILSEENKRQIWIPPGFAHGFLVISENAVFQYGVSNPYNKESEKGIIWNDKDININWKKSPFIKGEFLLSDKDKALPTAREQLNF